MSSPEEDEQKKENGKNPKRIRNLGLLGALLAAFSLINAYDALADFSGVVKYVVDKWRFIITEFWNFILPIFGCSTITKFDAVFLTFFTIMILTLLTSFAVNDPNLSKARFRQGTQFTILGLLILAAIFAFGDMTTYDVVEAERGAIFYQDSIQAFFYEQYAYVLKPETWEIPSQYGYYANIVLLFGFYLILICVTLSLILIFSYVFGLYVDVWNIASRIWMIIMFFFVVIGFNYIIVYAETWFGI